MKQILMVIQQYFAAAAACRVPCMLSLLRYAVHNAAAHMTVCSCAWLFFEDCTFPTRLESEIYLQRSEPVQVYAGPGK